MLKIKKTIAQLRDAARLQLSIGVYDAMPRELPALSWVWYNQHYNQHYNQQPLLGVILDITGTRVSGSIEGHYIVITTEGQFIATRAELVPATFDEVRAAEGLSVEQDIQEAISEALQHGPSEANTMRYMAAARAMQGPNATIPNVIQYGHW